MRKLNLEPSEVIRRFLISSAFESSRVIIVSPAEYLAALKRVVFYPYTHGETPWNTICDLSKIADTTVVTTAENMQLICRLAECSMRRYDHRLQLYLSEAVPLILVNDREAIKDDILVTAEEDEYKKIQFEAEEIVKKSKLVDYGMYLDLLYSIRR